MVRVKPVLGQNRTRLLDGALVRPDHAHIPVLDKDIGADITADWNNLIPSDKETRRYLTALWDDPRPQVDRLNDAARTHLLLWGGAGAATGLAAVTAVWVGLGLRRRRLAGYHDEQAALVTAHNRRLRTAFAVIGTGVLLVVDAAGLRIYLHEDRQTVVGSPVFAGTSLEGTQANGLVAEVLPLLELLEPKTSFYDGVSDRLEEALAARSDLVRDDDEVVFVLAEDFEDVNGMARQVGLTASLVDASFVALTGDLTFAGRAVETYIIDTVDYYSEGRPVYLAPGLHDTQTVIDAARARGWHVGEGEVEEVDGIDILSFTDPRVSTVGSFGADDLLRDPDVDVETFLETATETACAETPQVVFVHDRRLGSRIAESGCVEVAVFDGRSFTYVGPKMVETTQGGQAVEYTSGSAGGHVDTRPDPGPVKNQATFSIITIDPETGDGSYSVVTVEADGTVRVSLESELPKPIPPSTTIR